MSKNLPKIKLPKGVKNDFSPRQISQAGMFMASIIKEQRSTLRRELDAWRSARSACFASVNPSSARLMSVYQDAMLDAHLTAIISNNRILPTKNKRYVLRSPDGQIDDSRSRYFSSVWHKTIIRGFVESIFYGYTAIWLEDVMRGKVRILPRENVNPFTHNILRRSTDLTGFDFANAPMEILFAQGDGLGLLEKAVPMTILKRHSWSNWDEFEQIFGMPIRIAKVASYTQEVQTEVAGWLKELGSAAYGIFPLGTDVEIKESNRADACQVFMQKISEANKELSKLILGQTGTTDEKSFDGAALVHRKTLEDILWDDVSSYLSWANEQLLPSMRYFGYDIPDGFVLDVDDTEDMTPSERIKVDDAIMQHSGYSLSKDYLENTYGVRFADEKTSGVSSMGDVFQRGDDIFRLSDSSDDDDEAFSFALQNAIKDITEAFDTAVNLTYEQKGAYDPISANALREECVALTKATYSVLQAGVAPLVRDVNPDFAKSISKNLCLFSGAKSVVQLRALTDFLLDDTGHFVDFNAFRSRVETVFSSYNNSYLHAEYYHAVSTTQMASLWHSFAKGAHRWDLQYNAVMDAHTRAEHSALNGFVAPFSSPVWDVIFPPNGWNCRCSVSQVPRGSTSSVPEQQALLIGRRITSGSNALFRFNAGKSRMLFPNTHPYFMALSAEEKDVISRAVADAKIFLR